MSNQLIGSAPLAVLMAALMVCAPSWAVNKCTGPDGKVSFQDAPCSGRGEALTVRPSGGSQSAAPLAPAPQAQPAPTPPEAAAPPAPTAPQKTMLEVEAEQCLAWYRPLLRDPAGAYYREPSKDARVLSITIHATNGYGGYVPKRAACEFVGAKLDDGWTKIQAKRAGWSVE